MVEPVAFLVPRITGNLGVSECTFVFVCAMPCGHLSITGQAEDGCDSQMDAGVWVSAALRLWVGYLVQRGHLEELGWGPRSSVQRRSCWCPMQSGCCWSTLGPLGSALQHGEAHSHPGHHSWGAELRGEQHSRPPLHPCSRIWVAFGNTLAPGYY